MNNFSSFKKKIQIMQRQISEIILKKKLQQAHTSNSLINIFKQSSKYLWMGSFILFYCSSCAHKSKTQLKSPCVMQQNLESPFFKHPCNFKPLKDFKTIII